MMMAIWGWQMTVTFSILLPTQSQSKESQTRSKSHVPPINAFRSAKANLSFWPLTRAVNSAWLPILRVILTFKSSRHTVALGEVQAKEDKEQSLENFYLSANTTSIILIFSTACIAGVLS